MDQFSENVIIAIVGTMAMLVLVMFIIVFFVLYQRKIARKQQEIQAQENAFQLELTKATLQSKESEQRRIAGELHDEIGSKLTSIKIGMNTINIPEDQKNNIDSMLKETIQSVRRISNEMMPSVLEEFGLIDAIKNLVSVNNKNNIIDTNYISSVESLELTSEQELGLYRIIQELINNIVKYANASKVNIDVKENSDNISLIIIDNGNGFEPTEAQLKKSNSLGLKNILTRLQLLNGEIKYEPNKSKGTTTTVKIKL